MTDRPDGTVAEVGERALIERLRRRVGRHPAWIALGIGDDAAIIEPARGESIVLTTDSLIEDVHFRRRWTPPAAIGRKALAVSLSDLAAMGAAPQACLLSLGLPGELAVTDFDALLEGLLELSASAGAPLVGGNIARSPGPLIVDVTVHGCVRKRRALLRSGGRPGDELYVTGVLGGARAGVRLLEAGLDREAAGVAERECVSRHERPEARLRTGRAVSRQRGASAAMDLSDGLADGVRQIAEASGAGAVIDRAAVPVDPAAAAVADRLNAAAFDLALEGGEDYELLFAVPPRRRRAFLAAVKRAGETTATRIGRLTTGRSLTIEEGGASRPLADAGFAHFRS